MKDEGHISRRQRVVLWLVLAAVPVLFFVVLEGGLRLFGYGTDTRLFVRDSWENADYYRVNPGVVRRYFSSPSFATYVSRDRFLVEKPANSVRIFCLGASTTVGFPYLYNGSYSSMIADRLSALFPEARIEMVNLGITAVTSFTVAELAREVVRYEPDLLIVYTGHNEFYGALGIASTEGLGGSLGLVKTYLWLQRWKTTQLVRDAIARLVSAFRPAERPSGQLMGRLARDQYVVHGSPQYESAREHFRENLEEVVDVARARDVPVLLSTLVSNLSGLPPFVSIHRENLPKSARDEFEALMDRAAEARAGAASDGDGCDSALPLLNAALEIDGSHAGAHFERGRCLMQTQDPTGARAAFARARDLDALRFRASGDFNATLKAVAERPGVSLVDMERIFDQQAGEDVVGDALFWEHVHPRLEGYRLMADAFVGAMAQQGLVRPREQWDMTRALPDSVERVLSGITPLDLAAARLRIDLLKSDWPFEESERQYDFEPSSVAEAMAWDYVRNRITWARAHDRLGRHYREQGRLAEAAREMLAVGKVTTYDPTYLVASGDLFAQAGEYRLSAEVFVRALQIEESPLLHAKAASARLEIGEPSAAAWHFERAFALDSRASPDIPPALRIQFAYLTAQAYLRMEDEANARRHLEWLQARAPQAPQTVALRSQF